MSIKVLMVGYNGANNTGAEALLQRDIEDVRSVFGEEARISIPTLNEANLRRYVAESETLRIVPMPTLYFGTIRRLVREHDLVLLVEGSTYMDTWGSPLLWAFLWATSCAHSLGRRCLAYAVDAGSLSPANRERVRRTASLTDLIITRSEAAAARLRAWGVRAPITATADNAFLFEPAAEDPGRAEAAVGVDDLQPPRRRAEAMAGRDAAGRGSGDSGGIASIGIAAVDFHLWPAVLRPWGRKRDCYKWPYYFSRSRERSRAREELTAGYAALIDDLVERRGRSVTLICMEQLDEPLACSIHSRVRQPGAVRICSAREHDASQMTRLLRGLELLVTSRFHASVLSLAAAVPQIAIGHDARLEALHHDLGLGDRWFIDRRQVSGSELFARLGAKLEALFDDPTAQRETLRRGYEEQVRRARRNRELLAGFAEAHFPHAVRKPKAVV